MVLFFAAFMVATGLAVSPDDPQQHAVGERVDGGARGAMRLVDLVLAHHGPGPVHDEDLDGTRRRRGRPGRVGLDRDERLDAGRVGTEVTGRVDLSGLKIASNGNFRQRGSVIM